MAEWEVCQIVEMDREHLLIPIRWWEARQSTTQGEVRIAKSSEFQFPGCLSLFLGGGKAYAEQRRAAHSQVVAQLVAQGWEPAGTNDEGLLSVMKRAV